ncbi:hypothetical protein F4777DRAFT_569795 [Nemania sp. FL0916]|nr:hypothetical protein F4777DRAFT_569795 [Nemania sp. FL0916]
MVQRAFMLFRVMASTQSQVPDSNQPPPPPPRREVKEEVIENGESSTDIPAKGKGKQDSTIEEQGTRAQSRDAAIQKLKQAVTSLEQQLDSEKKLRIKAQANLKGVMKEWKKLAQELDKQHTDVKPFQTVTDDYLKELAGELRYDIRCFSELFFEDLPPQPWPQQPPRVDSHSQTRILPELYDQCPSSPALAQSFIWRVLGRKVFEYYEWPVGRSVGTDMWSLSEFLRPNIGSFPEPEGPSKYEALKKFYVWRATTANMILSAEDTANQQDRWNEVKKSLMKKYFDPTILIFIPESEDRRYYDLLTHIIEKALFLDRVISTQASWVRWVFEDADSQSEAAGNAASVNQETVRVISAPAMIKRGKSSGDGFEEEIELLPADTCVVRNLPSSRAYREEDYISSFHDPFLQ